MLTPPSVLTFNAAFSLSVDHLGPAFSPGSDRSSDLTAKFLFPLQVYRQASTLRPHPYPQAPPLAPP